MSWPMPPPWPGGQWNANSGDGFDSGSYQNKDMSMQEWQQWAQWQQQYSQWQRQYGEQYAQMQAMQGMQFSLMATAAMPAPPPPDKPPPPPPPHENDEPLYAKPSTQSNLLNNQPYGNTTSPNLNTNTTSNSGNNLNQHTIDNASSDKSEALKKIEEEEKLFDIQFKKWELEIDKWKSDNANHPDKKAYSEYETKFIACRAQLLERRKQMDLRKAKLLGHTVDAIPTTAANIQSTFNQQTQNAYNNYNQTGNEQTLYNDNNKNVEPQDRYDAYNDTNMAPNNYIQSIKPTVDLNRGIPGLDLVPKQGSATNYINQSNTIDITNDKNSYQHNETPDYSTISRGINSILGDEKIMNVLNMVRDQNIPVQQDGSQPKSAQLNTQPPNRQAMNRPMLNNQSNMQPPNRQAMNRPMLNNQFSNNQNFGTQNQNQQNQRHGNLSLQNPNRQMGNNMQNLQTNNQRPQNMFNNQSMPVRKTLMPTNQPRMLMNAQPTNALPGMMNPNQRQNPNLNSNNIQFMQQRQKMQGFQQGQNVTANNSQDYNFNGSQPNVGPTSRGSEDLPNSSINRAGPVDDKSESKTVWAEFCSPSIVVDYDHKPLRLKVRDFIEPVHTFDYNHVSKENGNRGADDVIGKMRQLNSRRSMMGGSSERLVREPPPRPLPPPPSEYRRHAPYVHEADIRRDRYDGNMRRDRNYPPPRRSQEPDRSARHRPMSPSSERIAPKRPIATTENENERYERVNKKMKDSDEIKHSKKIMIDEILEMPGRDMRAANIALILRGPPGSGKSYLAKLIREKEAAYGTSIRVMSIDDYFTQESTVEEKDPVSGKMVKKIQPKYEYDAKQEATYRSSLHKSFMKTIDDGFFSFVILDDINPTAESYCTIWKHAKQHNFAVYVCTLELDPVICWKRNIHGRSQDDIKSMCATWVHTPASQMILDPSSLLAAANAITNVHMEDVDGFDGGQLDKEEVETSFTSKWEKLDDAGQLARLDGTSKPLRPSATAHLSMEDYLKLDDWQPAPSKPGKKSVRWADIEETRAQEKMRAIGFVVGQTDWQRMTDPTMGSSALTQTKYIERVPRGSL